jgi:hypothetical protein
MARQLPPEFGFSERSTLHLVEAREELYRSIFTDESSQWSVDHELLPMVPHLDVYVFPMRGEDEEGNVTEFFALVTGGMSDFPMNVPEGLAYKRAELVMYAREPKPEYIRLLRFLARLPHQQEATWYFHGTTMTNGQPPQPIFDGSSLDCYLFLCSPDQPEDSWLQEDELTMLLWVVPITRGERQFIMDRDLEAFIEAYDQTPNSLLLNERRQAVV